jgi:hypothetical protein
MGLRREPQKIEVNIDVKQLEELTARIEKLVASLGKQMEAARAATTELQKVIQRAEAAARKPVKIIQKR